MGIASPDSRQTQTQPQAPTPAEASLAFLLSKRSDVVETSYSGSLAAGQAVPRSDVGTAVLLAGGAKLWSRDRRRQLMGEMGWLADWRPMHDFCTRILVRETKEVALEGGKTPSLPGRDYSLSTRTSCVSVKGVPPVSGDIRTGRCRV